MTMSRTHWLNVLVVVSLVVLPRCAEGPVRPWEEDDPNVSLDPNPSAQDVIPINGDSSAPVDEIMDGGGLHLVSWKSWKLSPPVRPISIYRKRADGDVDLQIITAEGMPPGEFRQHTSLPIVLVPLRDSNRPALERYIASHTRPGSGVHVTHGRLHAYCVEAEKPAGPAGTLFAVARGATAQRFDAIQGLLRIADHAARDGILKPQGDPQAYGRFIAQYAVWTRLEGWDQKKFTDEFIARTRRTTEDRHQPWTSETEQTLRALAPARWSDIQVVFAAVDKVEAKERISGGLK